MLTGDCFSFSVKKMITFKNLDQALKTFNFFQLGPYFVVIEPQVPPYSDMAQNLGKLN